MRGGGDGGQEGHHGDGGQEGHHGGRALRQHMGAGRRRPSDRPAFGSASSSGAGPPTAEMEA